MANTGLANFRIKLQSKIIYIEQCGEPASQLLNMILKKDNKLLGKVLRKDFIYLEGLMNQEYPVMICG
jgi:hypothetical protein